MCMFVITRRNGGPGDDMRGVKTLPTKISVGVVGNVREQFSETTTSGPSGKQNSLLLRSFTEARIMLKHNSCHFYNYICGVLFSLNYQTIVLGFSYHICKLISEPSCLRV